MGFVPVYLISFYKSFIRIQKFDQKLENVVIRSLSNIFLKNSFCKKKITEIFNRLINTPL